MLQWLYYSINTQFKKKKAAVFLSSSINDLTDLNRFWSEITSEFIVHLSTHRAVFTELFGPNAAEADLAYKHQLFPFSLPSHSGKQLTHILKLNHVCSPSEVNCMLLTQGPGASATSGFLSAFSTSNENKSFSNKTFGPRTWDTGEKYKNPKCIQHRTEMGEKGVNAVFCPDVDSAGCQLGTTPCVNPTQVRCQQIGQAQKSEGEPAGDLFACCRLPSNIGVCWTRGQGTFGPQHIKCPGKSNPPGQKTNFKRKRKKNKRCNST